MEMPLRKFLMSDSDAEPQLLILRQQEFSTSGDADLDLAETIGEFGEKRVV
jgi:hypothetical protein